MSSTQKLKLGEILVQAGLLTELQLRLALGEQQRSGGHLGSTLVGMGMISESLLTRALASQLELPIVKLAGKQIHPDILELLPAQWAIKHHVIPLFVREESGEPTLFVGIDDPNDQQILEEVRLQVGTTAAAVVVAPSELQAALDLFYGADANKPAVAEAADRPLAAGISSESAIPVETTRSVQSLSERALAGSRAHVGGEAPSPRTVLKALAQLLIEKGLIERQEFNERVVSLHAEKSEE